jgi:hypothetical protein
MEPEGVTPLMMACKIGWTEGVWELIRSEASLTATDAKGMTARMYAEKAKKTEVVQMIDDWLRPDDEPAEETYASAKKKADIEATKARLREEAERDEQVREHLATHFPRRGVCAGGRAGGLDCIALCA